MLQEGKCQGTCTSSHQDAKRGEDVYHAKALHPPPGAIRLPKVTVLEVLQLQAVNYSLNG